MKISQLILLLSLSFLAFGCSKDGEDGDGKGKLGARGNLNGLSAEELIQEKYESLMVACELRVQALTGTVRDDQAVQEFRFGLMNNPFQAKTFQLTAFIPGHDLKATIQVNGLKIIGYYELQLLDGRTMVAENSPSVEAQVEFSWVTRYSDGTYTDGGGRSRRLLTEGPGDQILNREESRGTEIQKIIDTLNCRLDGQIRPEYQDQLRYK